MSKYTTDRNGVTIGSDNLFHYWDNFDEMHDFNAILWFQLPYPKRISFLNVNIKSFAHQLVFDEYQLAFPTTTTFERPWKTFYKPNSWMKKWLDENAPGWGMMPPSFEYSEYNPTIFFKKVTHAWAFRKLIATHLEGLPKIS